MLELYPSWDAMSSLGQSSNHALAPSSLETELVFRDERIAHAVLAQSVKQE